MLLCHFQLHVLFHTAKVTVPDSAVGATLSEALVCPYVATNTFGVCLDGCSSDSDCTGSQKCCSNGCGHYCTAPESVPFYKSPKSCPKAPVATQEECPSGCNGHSACEDEELCCSTGCGSNCITALKPSRICTEAFSAASSPGLIGAYIPQCDVTTGHFTARQCHGSTGMCWCVDPLTGEPRTGSTRKALNCSSIPTSKHNPQGTSIGGHLHVGASMKCPLYG